ncbi:MAG: sugar MFS transporter [Flavobacteriales bacterium]|nr:sugar MFS transporter [Flavobacteriales bacterium]
MTSPSYRNDLRPILILGALFFIFGFVTWLNGTLIPYLKIACELSTFQSLFVAFAFYISYFVMALPSSWVLSRTGFKNGMMLGLLVMAVGALLFIPAARTRTYGMFLTGLFVIGTGLSLLQTASNPYITILGPIERAAQRISIMGICNKVAGVLAPIVLGAVVLHDADGLMEELTTLSGDALSARLDGLALRVVVPYALMSVVLVGLAMLVRLSNLPAIKEGSEGPDPADAAQERTSVLQFPQLVLGAIALFLYVGVEVIAGDTIGTYAQEQGIPLSSAKHFTSYTLAAMVVGYILGILAIPRWISQERALSISAITGTLFGMLALMTTGYLSVLSIALLGLANALVWPAIWPLAIAGLGRFTKVGSAILIMAIAGGALMPLLYGWLADMPSLGARAAYLVLLPAYLFILWYGTSGHRKRSWG